MSPRSKRDWRLYADDIEIIGEAAKHIPDEVVAKAPEIAWQNIRGMRDIIAHGYFQTSLEIVWATATTRIDELDSAVRKLVGGPSGS